MRLFTVVLAGLTLGIGTADARPMDDHPLEPEPSDVGRPAHGLDRQLVVAAPQDPGWDTGLPDRYVVRLGKALPLRDAALAKCGVLTLGGVGQGDVERLIELHVELASQRTPLDRVADIGSRPGQMTVHLNPPSPEWAKGTLNVDFECDGSVNAHYPVFVLLADAPADAPDDRAEDDTEGDVDAELEGQAGSGCSAAPASAPTGAGAALLAGLTLLGLRRRPR